MKIAVLLKQIPDTESKILIASDRQSILEDEIKWVINPYDEIALEEALRLKEKNGGEVVIVTAGPLRASESVRQALAIGADRGIHIETKEFELDPFLTALILTNACRPENFDIIFAGKVALDDGFGFVHIGVAEALQIPHVSCVEKFEISSDNKSAKMTRADVGSTKEIVSSNLPLLVGCEKGLNEPRYATLPGILKAKSKPIKVLNGLEMLHDEKARIKTTALNFPAERKAAKIIKGNPQEAAEELARLLREEVKVI